ncbi:MAG: autotransporter-associated beta strand repeat-containing protein, partial [Cyclobacteriaceae bacterium]|nr:autotransporter-associated beta strand repeat-containing protein [Cyclobacteriaceae bacterium]
MVIIAGGDNVTLDVNTGALTSLTIDGTLTTTGAYTVDATTITVNGTYTNGSTGAITVTTMFVNGGATYDHAVNMANANTIPSATWAPTSNFNVTGVVSNAPTGFGQTFGNLTWNSVGQTINAYLQSNITIQGDFTVLATGASFDPNNLALRMSNNATGYTIGVTGNVSINGNSSFKMNNGSGSCTMNVGGDFTLNNGNFTIVTGNANSTLSVTGNVNILGGNLLMHEDGSATTATLNVTGNFVHTGGTINETGGGVGSIVFNKNGTQSYTSGGTVLNTINHTVNSLSVLQMATAGTAIEGDGSFTLSAGATLGITSVDGITATGSGAVGNIQVTGSRNYSTNANYIYNGSSDQDVGDGLPGTVNNLTIDNSGGGGNNAVSLDSDVAISGTLTVSQGEFDLNGNNVTSVGSVVLTGTTITGGGGITLAGNITTNSSPSTATIDVPVALGGADRIFTVANGGANPDLTISGNISGANAIQKSGTGTLSLGGNNTYSGTTTLSSGTLNINSATAIGTGALTISGGSIGNTSGGPITLSNNNAQNWNSDFTFEGTNDLNVGAGPVSISANRIVTVNSNILTVGGVVSAATFDLTKTGAGTLGFGTNAVTINNLTNSGPLKAPSNVLSIAGNFINTGTFDNAFGTVHYNGAAAQLVAPVTYQNLTLSSSGAKNAGGNITVNNLLNNSAVFDLGTNALTATTINNTGTIRFSGPNNGLAVNGGTIEYYGASQTVAAGAYNNLTINQSSGEAGLSGDTDVNGTLALTARNLNLLGNNLTLGPGAGISVASPSASKMIIDGGGGQLRKEFTATGSFIFPIGDNSGALEYSPVTVNVTAAGGFAPGAYVAASVIDAKHPNNASASDFITRYWEITTSGITTPTVDVTGTYTVADLGGFTDSNVSAAQLDGVFNQTSNPWVKRAVLSGTTLAITGAPLTDGQISVFTGITLAPPTVSIDNGAAVTICEGSTVGLTTTAGGIPTLIYSWSPAANLSSTIIPNPVFTGNTVGGPTAYTVTVTDGNGITASDIINITVTTAPTADAGVATGVTCEDTSFTVTDASESNSSSILWTENGAGSFTPGTETTLNPVYNPVAADGGNLVTLTFTVNGNGSCTAAVDTKVLTIYKLPTVAAAGPDIFQCNTTAFTMAANSAIVGTG